MNPNYPSLWSQPQPSADPLKPVIDPAPPYESRPNSLADLGVADILERYQHDTELLKHILMAKAEEDKRRAAEEIRLAEEARLQAKYLDLLEGSSQHSRRTSDLIEGFDALGNNEAPQAWFNNGGSNLPMMSQHVDKTPPSPSPTNFMPPPSPYTMFDVPFEQLTISSSPEPSKQKANSSQRNSLNVPTIATPTTTNNNNNATTTPNTQTTHTDSLTPPSPPPPPPHAAPRERPCKRTLSRTRSQRKGPPKTSTNKRNKRVSQQQQLSDDEQQQQQQSQQPQQQQQQQQQQPQQQQQQQQQTTAPEEPQLDHGKVMEALRAKLQRSAALQPHQQQQHLKQEQQDQTPNSMSPTGILLLDLKNPNRKSFPTRKPHVAAVRRPRPFASAHNYCESSVKKEQG